MNTFYFFKGRVALYAILKAIDVGPGHEIILPGFTCVVVPNAISYLGARPAYVDIDPRTYNIDVSKLEQHLTSRSSLLTHPKAIIAQHTFGIPAAMDRIVEIARKYNLYVIEDSCHAIGSKYKGKEVGSFGDASFFSSQWSKPVTTGLGGWAVINNDNLKANMERIYLESGAPSYKESLLLRLQYLTYSKFFKPALFWFAQDTYRRLSKKGLMIGSSYSEELQCKMPGGYAKRMSVWQRDLIEKKLREIHRDIRHRKLITSIYENCLREKGVETVHIPNDCDPVFLRYPIMVKDKGKVLNEARKRRIEIGDWFLSPLHPNLSEWEKAGYQKGTCPIAEQVCRGIINLPTHREISTKEAERIVQFIVTL